MNDIHFQQMINLMKMIFGLITYPIILTYYHRRKEVRTMANRNTYKYHLKRGNRIIRSGMTNDLDRREQEHQSEHGQDVHIYKVGRATTRDAARDWEKRQRKGTP